MIYDIRCICISKDYLLRVAHTSRNKTQPSDTENKFKGISWGDFTRNLVRLLSDSYIVEKISILPRHSRDISALLWLQVFFNLIMRGKGYPGSKSRDLSN